MFMSEKEEAEDLKKLGNDSYKAGKFEKAIEYYSNAIQLNACKEYYSNRVLTLLKVGRFEEALSDCDSIRMLDSDWPKGLHLRGITLEKLERLEEARKDFTRLLQSKPNDEKAKQRIQLISKKLGDEETVNPGTTPEPKTKGERPPQTPTKVKSPKKSSSDSNSAQLERLRALNKKLTVDLRAEREKVNSWKRKYEALEQKPKPKPKSAKQKVDHEKESMQKSEEIKRLQTKLAASEKQNKTLEDEQVQLRQQLNKLSGKKMTKWNTDQLFQMIDAHSTQLNVLHKEMKRRFAGKKGRGQSSDV